MGAFIAATIDSIIAGDIANSKNQPKGQCRQGKGQRKKNKNQRWIR